MPDDKEKLAEEDYKYLLSFHMLEKKKGQFLQVVKEYNLALLLVNKSDVHLTLIELFRRYKYWIQRCTNEIELQNGTHQVLQAMKIY